MSPSNTGTCTLLPPRITVQYAHGSPFVSSVYPEASYPRELVVQRPVAAQNRQQRRASVAQSRGIKRGQRSGLVPCRINNGSLR